MHWTKKLAPSVASLISLFGSIICKLDLNIKTQRVLGKIHITHKAMSDTNKYFCVFINLEVSTQYCETTKYFVKSGNFTFSSNQC